MKPHSHGTELKVGTTRAFTQPKHELETDAEADKPREDNAPAPDADSLTGPTTADTRDI